MFEPSPEDWELFRGNLRDILSIGSLGGWRRRPCTPCPYSLKRLRHTFVMQQCYQNSATALALLNDPCMRYVLGVMDGYPMPIAHAWLKIGDEYHDPTLELAAEYSKNEIADCLHRPIAELTLNDVGELARAEGGEFQFPTLQHLAANPSFLLPKTGA